MSTWSGVAAAYSASFASLCAGTIPEILTRLRSGRLLDVGCGTGELMLEARERGFDVSGVDADLEMVALARLAAPGLVARAALPALPFADGAFDTVVANFVVNHVPDPRAAVRELVRVTAPGGRLAVTIWPPNGAGWADLVGQAFAAASVVPLARTHLPEHLDFPRSVDGLASITAGAGAEVVEATEVEWTWRVTPESLWAGISGGVATVGETFRAQTPEVQVGVRREFFKRAADAAVDGCLELPSRAVLVIAQRPGQLR